MNVAWIWFGFLFLNWRWRPARERPPPPNVTAEGFIPGVRRDPGQPQHFNLQDGSWDAARLEFPPKVPPPPHKEQTCLYHHVLNGSVMKGLLAIRQEGGGGWAADRTTDGFQRPPGNVNVSWELRGLRWTHLNSSFHFPPPPPPFQAWYCGSGCHGSSWFPAVRTAVWGGCVDSDKTWRLRGYY